MPLVRGAVEAFTGRRRGVPGIVASGRVDLLSALFTGMRTSSGAIVTRETALTVGALWRACSIIASVIGAQELRTYERLESGMRKPIWLAEERFIWDKPNREVFRSIHWETTILHCLMHGNAFTYVVAAPGEPRRPAELYPIDPLRVQVGRDERSGRKAYLIDGTTPAVDWVSGGTIVHTPGLGLDGLVGISLLQLMARTLGLAISSEDYAARWFGQGSAPGGVLMSEQPLSPEQAEELSDSWEEHHRGHENTHRLAVLGRGTKYQSTMPNPKDVMLIESRGLSKEDIATFTGLPLWMLGAHSKDSSWGSGLEEQFRGFITLTLDPMIQRVQGTASDELLRESNHFCEFDTTKLTRGKLGDQVEAAKTLVDAGYDPAESLNAVGLDPIKHTGRAPVGGAPNPEPAAVAPVEA